MFPSFMARRTPKLREVGEYYRDNLMWKIVLWLVLSVVFVWSSLNQHWLLYVVVAALIGYCLVLHRQLAKHLRG
jgi:hypothetical protein